MQQRTLHNFLHLRASVADGRPCFCTNRQPIAIPFRRGVH